MCTFKPLPYFAKFNDDIPEVTNFRFRPGVAIGCPVQFRNPAELICGITYSAEFLLSRYHKSEAPYSIGIPHSFCTDFWIA